MLHVIFVTILVSIFAPGSGSASLPDGLALSAEHRPVIESHRVRRPVAGEVRMAVSHETMVRAQDAKGNVAETAGLAKLPERDPHDARLVSMVAKRCLELAAQKITAPGSRPAPRPPAPKPVLYCGGFGVRAA